MAWRGKRTESCSSGKPRLTLNAFRSDGEGLGHTCTNPTCAQHAALSTPSRELKFLFESVARKTDEHLARIWHSLEAALFSPSKSQRQTLHRFANFCIVGTREGTPGWGPATHSTASTSEHKTDSLLSTATSVTFEPARQPVIDEQDEDVPMPTRRGKKAGRRTSVAAASGPHPGSPSLKGKGKGKGKAEHMTFEDMVHEGDWANSEPSQPFKHKFQASCGSVSLARFCDSHRAPSGQFVLEEASFTEEKYELFR